MNTYQIKWRAENFANGVRARINKELVLELPSEVGEITMRKWVRCNDVLAQAPELEGGEEAAAAQKNWLTFVAFAKRVIEVFAECDLSEALAGISAQPNQQNSIVAMYSNLVSLVRDYVPKHRDTFKWKGATFALPETVRQSFEQVIVGANLSVMEATDALQIEHVFGAKNEDGSPAIEDARYHNDIALVASICRRVKHDGSLEMPPLDFIERRQWFDKRIELFADLPMDIALDVGFFLISSKIASARILLLLSHLNRLQQARQPERR